MLKKVTTWIGVYEEEIQLFLWTVLLLFIVRSSGTILNNYSDAVFLKRYGVEYMPIVNMLNAIATVVVMGFVAGLIQRMSGTSLLIRMFVLSGISMLLIRLLIPLELSLIYPLLFMLKAQYEVLLALLFWNMANDLFNTQQAKRLFPLITAGGVIGQILSSFATPWVARVMQFDNLLIGYMLLAIAGALAVYFMAQKFPTLLSGGADRKGASKKKESMIAEFQRIWPLVKESTLIKIMVMLTFMPNVIIPIINYQFNYAVDQTFDSEDGLLEFFGYMRGALNIISLVLLLFVGKIYGRWGLPVALMFHPFNYVLAFMSFLFKFDLFSALYARMSTQILRTSINVPATNVLSGLFPAAYRAMVRPFLRGTVVRIGLFLGSTLILISDKLFHPRYLSLVAMPFLIAWLMTPFWLKRRYTDILTDLVSGDMGDIRSLENEDVQQLFREPAMRRKLRADFSSSQPDDALFYGQLLHQVQDKELDDLVRQKLTGAPPAVRAALMDLLTQDDQLSVDVLAGLAFEDDPPQQVAAIRTMMRLVPEGLHHRVDLSSLLQSPSAVVSAHATAAMLPSSPERLGELIRTWVLDETDPQRQLAGIAAAGASRSQDFVPLLSRVLEQATEVPTRQAAIEALREIAPPQLNALVAPDLDHPAVPLREAAVSALKIEDKAALRRAIELLGDSSPGVVQAARQAILTATYQDGKQLIRALQTPRRKIREEIFKILDVLDIKDLDIVRFIRGQAEGAYKYLIEAQAAKSLPESRYRELLITHLQQQGQLQVENMVRVLAAQDSSGRMRIVSRGLLSSDARQRANSLEALGDLLEKSVSRFIVPLIDTSPVEQKLAAARRFFRLEPFRGSAAEQLNHLLGSRHWVTRVLVLELARHCNISGIDAALLTEAAEDSKRRHVQRAAKALLQEPLSDTIESEDAMDNPTTISEKILLLKRIDIFEGLSVSELSAIATASEEVDYEAGERVIEQSDAGDTLYLIISGTVAVMKKREDGSEMELDQMTAGDYFGEMALFEDARRSASIVTVEKTRLLYLHKAEFNDMVREYPQIALAICGALSGRIRRLHQRMESLSTD